MDEERDLVTFTDDEGNEFELELIDYFEYECKEYAMLIDPDTADDDTRETEIYIMESVLREEEEIEEFLPVEDDGLFAELLKIAEEHIASWGEEDPEEE